MQGLSLQRHCTCELVLARQFLAAAPNHTRLADVTFVPTGEGWLYLALVLDLYTCKFVGWAMSESIAQDMTLETLQMARAWRDSPAGLMHHSDRGSECAAGDYRTAPAVSMSRKGDCWVNAPTESAKGTVKVECGHGVRFKTRAEAAQALVEYFGY